MQKSEPDTQCAGSIWLGCPGVQDLAVSRNRKHKNSIARLYCQACCLDNSGGLELQVGAAGEIVPGANIKKGTAVSRDAFLNFYCETLSLAEALALLLE